MSKYTTQLRWFVEQTMKDAKVENTEDNWHLAYGKLGLADYPIFDEAHREGLNNMIIRHYYTREIGAETIGRFAMFMREAMFLVMPYYNQLYESEKKYLGIDMMKDRDIVTEGESRGTTNANTSSDTTSHTTDSDSSQSVFSDTPQSEMIPNQIRDMRYATTVTLGESSSEGDANSHASGTSNGTSANTYRNVESGHGRPQAELVQLYREGILNIDRMVVEDKEIRDCFMGVW